MDSRRMQILQAALACTATNGYHHTTMRDICREAGLSIGAVYNYFKSIEDILAAMTRLGRGAKEDLFRRVRAAGHAKESLHELFRLMFLAYRQEGFRRLGPVDVETYGEALRNERVREIMLEDIDFLIRPLSCMCAEWQNRQELRDDIAPRYLASLIIAISVGIKISLLLQPELDIGRYEEVVHKALVESLWKPTREVAT